MLAGEIHHLCHLGLGNLVGEHAALPDAVMMDMQHDLGRRLDVLVEELLQYMDDEFHRRVVVVQDQHAIEVRSFGLRLDLGDDRSVRARRAARTVLVIAHTRSIGSGWRGQVKSGSQLRHGTGVQIPHGSEWRLPRDSTLRSSAQARRLIGSPLPTDPVRTGSFASNMGLPPARRKRAKVRPMAAAVPIPGPGDPDQG